MAEWERLTATTIRDYMQSQVEQIQKNQRIMEMLDTRTPEEKERARKQWEEEQARLAAIEAAKSPAQKLREKQAACHHEFCKRWGIYRCKVCKMRASKAYVLGYENGVEVGYDTHEDCY